MSKRRNNWRNLQREVGKWYRGLGDDKPNASDLFNDAISRPEERQPEPAVAPEPTVQPQPEPVQVPAPAVSKESTEMEKMAHYMVRGFHDWAAQGRYILEPGFRDLIGNRGRQINVHYTALRDDWEDDCRRAFDVWQTLGFEFVEAKTPELADIVVDDERKGAYALKRMTGVRREGNLWVVQSTTREINIWKEWPEQQLLDAIIHEIGHTLGLGHPGPYDGAPIPDSPMFSVDNGRNTIMSYFGSSNGRLGDADRLAIDMIYGG